MSQVAEVAAEFEGWCGGFFAGKADLPRSDLEALLGRTLAFKVDIDAAHAAAGSDWSESDADSLGASLAEIIDRLKSVSPDEDAPHAH